ncbi:nucleotidyltransferase family protein [Rhodovulum strictum]|uniref:NTP transferase domain-containing protein n=1 Tax=Rhodovulum strictum TaxID=58314 RepID=A0A844BIE4_9RHOB|nr:NTP transferase domain-containing protein [Rhodovulum strictum]MRH22329.1 NTP transferase domain-containing protein [Rhodovulum strictum]
MAELLILLPAAGASARMRGRDKLLEPVDGVALLRRQAMAALATGAPVLVTLPRGAGTARASALAGLAARIAWIDAAEGMAASLRAGAAAAQAAGASGLMVMLPDMPEITTEDLAMLRAAFHAAPDHALRACTSGGAAGHPVIFPSRLFAMLARVQGDAGGRAVLAGEAVQLLPLSGERALTDLDTPEDWADWRARTGR